MLKLLIGLIGLLEALYPDRFLAVLTDLSYEYEQERPAARPWVVTAARIEGVVLLGVALRAAIKTDRARKTAESTAPKRADDDSDSERSLGSVDRI